jgi:hypothetical protein
MSAFKFIHMHRLAELEKHLRDDEIELEEHLETCKSPEKNLITQLLEAKVRLALFRVQDYAITNNSPSTRVSG